MILPKKKCISVYRFFPVFQTHSQRFAVQLMRGVVANDPRQESSWVTAEMTYSQNRAGQNQGPEKRHPWNQPWIQLIQLIQLLKPMSLFRWVPRTRNSHETKPRPTDEWKGSTMTTSYHLWTASCHDNPSYDDHQPWKGKSMGVCERENLKAWNSNKLVEFGKNDVPWHHDIPIQSRWFWGSASVFRPLITSLRSTPDRMDACPSTKAHQPPIGNDANVHATAIVINSKSLKLFKSALQGDLR